MNSKKICIVGASGKLGRYMMQHALDRGYARIDRLEPSAARRQWYRPRDEWFPWPLGLALLLSVPAVLWSERWT